MPATPGLAAEPTFPGEETRLDISRRDDQAGRSFCRTRLYGAPDGAPAVGAVLSLRGAFAIDIRVSPCRSKEPSRPKSALKRVVLAGPVRSDNGEDFPPLGGRWIVVEDWGA